MASAFIGYTILVTLQHPPNAQVQGVVSDVVNQRLFLRDVHFRWTGQRFPHYTLDSSAIADLEIAHAQDENELPTPTGPVSAAPSSASTFVDPAILSFSKPATRPPQSRVVSNEPPVSPIMIADGAVPYTKPQALRGVSSISSIATTQPIKKPDRRTSNANATLTEPFDALAIDRKSAETSSRNLRSQTGPGIIDMKDINNGPLKQKRPGKGKGWRQTPLLEESANPRARGQRGRQREDDGNGWATEDATDIQDMGDFDFESNLSKFDKRRVFDDIRKDDKVAEGDRLVSYNRKVRPGTNGGRNLHFSENVLDPEDGKDARWKSEAGETEEDEQQEEHYSSGRGTRRAGSKKPVPSRKASVIPAHLERTASPRPLSRVNATSPLNGSISGLRASFRLANNNKPCACVSPLQMLELEQLCTAELGLTEDILSENAGRSIAEAVLKFGEVRNVLFLVGNHKTGARAIAAARHLRNRRLRVTVCLLGGDREELLLEIVRRQLNTYQKGLGYIERWDDYQSKLANGGPAPDVVVDALLGIHVAFEELRTDNQATAFEMIKWANRDKLTLSIDVPSGLSASSGLTAEVDGEGLMMNSKQVISLGAPKTGLLTAMAGDLIEAKWSVLVADVGISAAAWQKHGSRRKHGTEFGGEWVIEISVQATYQAWSWQGMDRLERTGIRRQKEQQLLNREINNPNDSAMVEEVISTSLGSAVSWY